MFVFHSSLLVTPSRCLWIRFLFLTLSSSLFSSWFSGGVTSEEVEGMVTPTLSMVSSVLVESSVESISVYSLISFSIFLISAWDVVSVFPSSALSLVFASSLAVLIWSASVSALRSADSAWDFWSTSSVSFFASAKSVVTFATSVWKVSMVVCWSFMIYGLKTKGRKIQKYYTRNRLFLQKKLSCTDKRAWHIYYNTFGIVIYPFRM